MTSNPRKGETLADRFSSVDWSFSGSVPQAPHGLHPYPARFIAELPASAIALVDGVPGTILDPFCGAGTTLVEAVRLGREAVGIDLNPIATLLTRTKLACWEEADELLLDKYQAELRWAAEAPSSEEVANARDRIPRLDHWFEPTSQRVLAGATSWLRTIDDPKWHDRIATAISASVVRLSRQDSDTRYAAVDKPVDTESALRILGRSLARVADQLRGFRLEHSGSATAVWTVDAAAGIDALPSRSVAAAVFSPPYPNAYEYWLYHKFRMYWLGYDPLSVRSGEWGARPDYSGSGRSTIETFRTQMTTVMDGVRRVLAPGGICFVVVGDSKIKGVVVDNGALFEGLAEAVGLEVVGRGTRTIRQTSKAFNLATSRAKAEHVLLLAPR